MTTAIMKSQNYMNGVTTFRHTYYLYNKKKYAPNVRSLMLAVLMSNIRKQHNAVHTLMLSHYLPKRTKNNAMAPKIGAIAIDINAY